MRKPAKEPQREPQREPKKGTKTRAIWEYMRANPPKYNELGYLARLAESFGTTTDSIRVVARRYNLATPRKGFVPSEATTSDVMYERKIASLNSQVSTLRSRVVKLTELLDEEEDVRRKVLEARQNVSFYEIKPKSPKGGSEAVAVAVASDWHVEETVDPKTVNGLNRYNLEISKECGEHYFRTVCRLLDIFSRDIKIDTLVLALLGDLISNDIHEELLEINALKPMEACIYAQNLIGSGIQYLLKNTKVNLVLPCHSGNHARTTYRVRPATEKGHSLEYFMYHTLAHRFQGEKRVKFLISDGYNSYLDVFNYTVRFHHGHGVRYQGGVGGLYIPMNKAIAQWDKAHRADISVCGHWHTLKDGGNFIVNGSMIGYNAYALSVVKADFEQPRQAFFLIDRDRGKTVVAPICFPER